MTSSSPRSLFEQQLCSQLLCLSEVAETLADRVMALEARLVEMESRLPSGGEQVAISEEAGELLLESEEKVRLLRDRLAPVEAPAAQAEDSADPTEPKLRDDASRDPAGLPDETSHDDVEYVDDPQIDLMTA